jgi:predicted metal-dependent phosphoesterase TrpH
MAKKTTPLLCELHAHTTWSDGALSVRELVDLYGQRGFDVLAVTDHTRRDGLHVAADVFTDYLAELEREAERARTQYGLLVLPGLELTYDDPDPNLAAHAVAVGLHEFVGVAGGLEPALAAARERGAALIAAHPYPAAEAAASHRGTGAFDADRARFAPLVDRYELFNRHTLFGWVAEAGLPVVATGDFHRPEHLATWKTMLPCEQTEEAVVDYLRSERPAYLVRLDVQAQPLERAA